MSPTPPIVVRTALRGDLAPCAAVFAVCQQEIEPRDPPWRPAEFADAIADEELLVAAAGTEVVGFLSWSRAEAFVHYLHVAPSWRRHGIGRRLLATARAERRRPLELKCLAGNRPALAFYRHLGWSVVSQSVDPPAPYLRLRQAA